MMPQRLARRPHSPIMIFSRRIPKTRVPWQSSELAPQPDICVGGTPSADSVNGAGYQAARRLTVSRYLVEILRQCASTLAEISTASPKVAREYTITGSIATRNILQRILNFRGQIMARPGPTWIRNQESHGRGERKRLSR